MTVGWPTHLFPVIDPPLGTPTRPGGVCPSCRNTGYVLSHRQTRGCPRCGRDPVDDIARKITHRLDNPHLYPSHA